MRLALATLVSGALFYLSIGAGTWWPAAWIAPVPILWCALAAPRARDRAVVGAAAAIAFAIGISSLIVLYRGVLPIAVLAPGLGLLALGYGACVVGFAWIAARSSIAAAWWLAAAWTGFEWVASLVSPHGTAGSIAFSQANVPRVIAMAAVTGQYGVTFALTLVPALLAVLVRDRTRGALIAMVAVIGAVLAIGAAVTASGTSRPPVRVAMIGSEAFDDAAGAEARDAALAPIARYRDAVIAAAGQGARVVVLPERLTAARAGWRDELDHALAQLARDAKVTLVVGVGDFAATPPRNAAWVYAPDDGAARVYAKRHLIPGLERDFTPGDRALRLDDGLAVAICKDLDFQDTAIANAGARVLLVPAWDFDVDAELHRRLSVVRGVEGGFAIARAARGGLLSVSDADGRVLAETRSASPMASLIVDVPVIERATWFPRLGGAFGIAALVLALAGLTWRAARRAGAASTDRR